MGGDALTASQVKAADRNGNGTLDIGDLRALVRNASTSVAPADISLALSGPGSGGGGMALGQPHHGERDSGDHRNDA